MFAFIKNLFKKPAPPTAAEDYDDEPELPGITFTIQPNGKIDAECFWPTPQTDEGFDLIVTRLGQLMYAVNQGRCYPIMQQALGTAALREGDDLVAQRVLHVLNGSMLVKQQHDKVNAAPCVPPTSAFDPRPDGVPLNG